MNLSPQALYSAAKHTLTDPAAAARQVMALRLTTSEAGMALAAIAVSATLLTSLIQLTFGRVSDAAAEGIFNHPLLLAVGQFAVMGSCAFLMWRVGRLFGGLGTFAQSLSLVAWLDAVLILLNLAGIVVLLVLPVLAPLILIALFLALFYLLTHFTAALNGFTSLPKTLIAILLTGFLTLVLISLLLFPFLPVPHV